MDVGDAAPVKQHQYGLNPSKQQYLKEEIKPNRNYRMSTDYRKVNNVTKTDTFPIPRRADCINQVGKAKYVTKFGLLKGFWQVPLTERAKGISAFATPIQSHALLYEKFTCYFPAPYQQSHRRSWGLWSTYWWCDYLQWNKVKHWRTTCEFFKRLSGAKLTINLFNGEFGQAQVSRRRHVVGQG